eukprot:gene6277-2743_t
MFPGKSCKVQVLRALTASPKGKRDDEMESGIFWDITSHTYAPPPTEVNDGTISTTNTNFTNSKPRTDSSGPLSQSLLDSTRSKQNPGDNCGSTGSAGGGEAGQQGRWKRDCRNDWTYGEETFKGSEMVQACMGGGGTQTAGGNAGSFPLEGLNLGIDAIAGDAYMGGGHGSYGNDGGAGYYGGGGGSHCPNMSGGSGGGGSSYAIKEASDVKHVQGGGARAEGDGSIIITTGVIGGGVHASVTYRCSKYVAIAGSLTRPERTFVNTSGNKSDCRELLCSKNVGADTAFAKLSASLSTFSYDYHILRSGGSQGQWDDDTRAEPPHILAGSTSIPEAMLRFTSKCSLLLLAVMPRWAYAEFECTGGAYLIDKSKCRVQDVNRVFEGRLDYCVFRPNSNYALPCALVVRCGARSIVPLAAYWHTADIFDNAGCVVQLQSNSRDRCEATAAKINGHPDYKGAPTIVVATLSVVGMLLFVAATYIGVKLFANNGPDAPLGGDGADGTVGAAVEEYRNPTFQQHRGGGAQQARNPAGTIKFIARNDALPLPRSPSGRRPAVLTVQADQKFLIPMEESPSVGGTEADNTNPSPYYLTPVTLNENYDGVDSNNDDYAQPVADYEPAPGGGSGGGSGNVDGLYVDDGFYDAHGTENGSMPTADAANAKPTVVYAQHRSLSEDAGGNDDYDMPTADAANAKPTIVYAQYRSLSEDAGSNDDYGIPTADADAAKPTVVYAQYRSLSEDAGSNDDYDMPTADAANAKPTIVYAQYRSLSEDVGSNGDHDIGNVEYAVPAGDDLNTHV